MPDREKVIRGLEICTNITEGDTCPNDCPYLHDVCYGYDQLMRDALALLKEQEEEIKRLKGELHGFGDLFHTLSEKAKVAMAEQPKVVRCKDCKHRPKKPNWETFESGADIEFPEGSKCPCHCADDEWYSWYPGDEWFCADGERKEGR